MEALILVVFVASTLGLLWHAHRGERVGSIEGVTLRRLAGRRLRLHVRRVRSGREARVQVSGLVYAVYRSASVSPDEAREWAGALDAAEPRRCGAFEIARGGESGDANRMLVTFPLDYGRYRLRLLLDPAQAREAARSLRAAAEPAK